MLRRINMQAVNQTFVFSNSWLIGEFKECIKYEIVVHIYFLRKTRYIEMHKLHKNSLKIKMFPYVNRYHLRYNFFCEHPAEILHLFSYIFYIEYALNINFKATI